jgi:hypothetical protein
MIKISDLRIGNRVLYNDKNETPTPVIIEIGLSDLILISNSVKDCVYTSIKLTPEILENNLGLKKVAQTSDEYKIGNIVLNICLYSDGYKVNVYLGGEFLGYHTTVHSLQNLFYSLTGVELKFVW